METKKSRKRAFLGFCLFALLPGLLFAQARRGIPLDLCLIIDGSAPFSAGKSEAISWVNRELVDGMLQDGDTLTIWSAGETAQMVYSETVGAAKEGIKELLLSLDASGQRADFTAALRGAASGNRSGRMGVTMLVSGSPQALAHSVGANSDLFRWSRIDEYSGWQVLVVAPSIGPEVRSAAADYMNSR